MAYHRGVAREGAAYLEKNLLLLKEGEQKYLDSRVDDLKKAGVRSRWIYGSTLVVSLMLFSVAYNELFSWYRGMAMGLVPDYDAKGWGDQLRAFMMKEWVASLQFDLPYVGGRFGASDAGLVGGISLFLLSIWCFYAAKRENHVLYFLMKDADDFGFSDAAKFYLRHQLAATQVFSVGNSKAYSLSNLKNKGLRVPAPVFGAIEGGSRQSSDLIRRVIWVDLFRKIKAFFFSGIWVAIEKSGVGRGRAIAGINFLLVSPIFMAPFMALILFFMWI